MEWQVAEHFVDAFLAVWDLKDPYRYVLSHKVIARDGYRCTTPHCGARRDLHSHHVIWRSHGGTDELESQTTVCWIHHDAIHEQRVRVSGTAPHALVWELGIRPDGSALSVIGPGEVILK